MTPAEAEAVLRSGDPRAISQLLRRLPEGVDPALAAARLLDWFDRDHRGFARTYRRLAAPVVRAVLDGLADRRHAVAIYLRTYLVGADDLSKTWDTALGHLLALESPHGFATKERRARLAALAAHPRAVAAVQAAVVASHGWSIEALAVLALDASDASADALMPPSRRRWTTGASRFARC